MLLALLALALVALVLTAPLVIRVARTWRERFHDRRERSLRRMRRREMRDPGRERRAEQRARELLRSCVNEEEWAMYRDLGFIRVSGSGGPRRFRDLPEGGERSSARTRPYAYLIYPHKPVVAYLPQTRALLNEYCVTFPDETRPYGSARLPDSDDVLAKWMALTGDERRLIATANMHLPGRQVDPKQVRRDLWRLQQWERRRVAHELRGGSVPTP